MLSRIVRACPSDLFLSLMSRKTRTAPTTRPAGSRIGDALSSMGRSHPSCEIRTVWLASPTTTPFANALRAGFSTSRRVSSLTMRKTEGSGCPVASDEDQP